MFPIHEVSGADVMFPARVAHLMPDYQSIPSQFKNGDTKWNRLFSDWFYVGVKDLKLTPRDGVDQAKAMRHIRCILGSFEPKHEHKEAAVAYLLDQWFSDGTWTQAKSLV